MTDTYKPEWVPKNDDDKFACRVMYGVKGGHDGMPNSQTESLPQTAPMVKRRKLTVDDYIEGVLGGDRMILSRAITLVESNAAAHFELGQQVIQKLLPYTGKSTRVGITGFPGAGKSTFIEALGTYLCQNGHKVAVLAVDPSSTVTKGSILGDKTRMEELVKDENAYIRPSASGDTLGGVARKTRETIILCEACGFDTIIIETVGVGQSETAVHSMVDFFLLLKISGAGDELQGIKRGIMEMADTIVINKADGDNIAKAKLAKTEFNRALHLFPAKSSGWIPKVTTCSAYEQTGINAIWDIISEYFELVKSNHYFEEKRQNQNQFWMMETINEQLKSHFYNHPNIMQLLEENKKAVQNNEISPFAAAQKLLEKYFKI